MDQYFDGGFFYILMLCLRCWMSFTFYQFRTLFSMDFMTANSRDVFFLLTNSLQQRLRLSFSLLFITFIFWAMVSTTTLVSFYILWVLLHFILRILPNRKPHEFYIWDPLLCHFDVTLSCKIMEMRKSAGCSSAPLLITSCR